MLKHLITFLFLLATLAAQAPVLVGNYAGLPQRGWVFVGIPDAAAPALPSGWLRNSSDQSLAPYVREPGGVRLWCSLAAGQMAKYEWVPEKARESAFAWHPVVETNAMRLLPHWTLGDEVSPPASFRVLFANDAIVRVHLRTVFASRRVAIDCWLTAQSGEPIIELVQCATYGDTRNDGQAQSVVLPELRIHSEGLIVDDESRRHGFGLATNSEGLCTQTCVPAGSRWLRGSRWVLRGAIMAVPDYARLESRPLVGLYTGWAGHWGPFGVVPTPNAEMVARNARQKAAWMERKPGNYLDRRDQVQGYASTTGENEGFGWASHQAVSTGEPWQVLDLLYQIEAYAARPTGNREPDGSPMQAIAHPDARTMNQRPDGPFGERDRIGWPGINRIEWISPPLWNTEDDEHRAPVDLAAAEALTRDPLVASIIDDLIELDRTDVFVRERRILSARAIGRLALSGAWWVWLGHRAAEPVLRQRLNDALVFRAAQYAQGPVKPIGAPEQAKYGWATTAGSAVRGWQPWQQVIAAGGLRAAALVLGSQDYDLASQQLATMVLNEAYREEGRALLHAYAIAFNDAQPLPAEAWPVMAGRREAWTDQVYVIPDTDTWTVGAALLMPSHPRAEMVRTRTPVSTTMHARWRALR